MSTVETSSCSMAIMHLSCTGYMFGNPAKQAEYEIGRVEMLRAEHVTSAQDIDYVLKCLSKYRLLLGTVLAEQVAQRLEATHHHLPVGTFTQLRAA